MSGRRIAVPPGRAGRLWLDRRLAAARRGADLLDRKLRILRASLGELRALAALTEREWRERSAQAERALLLAGLLGGQRAIRLAIPVGVADVRVDYAVTMGVRHPAQGHVELPKAPPWAWWPAEQARRAHDRALTAAVRHAVAAEAVRVVEAEAIATRYRLRAISDRLIPSLEQARAELALAIDELERADGARLRRAAAGGGGSRERQSPGR